MYLQNLSLKNFRIFFDIDITFNNGINIISGPNGQGKTSILEAIYYLALTRSFKSTFDKNVVNYKNDFFSIHGEIFLQPEKIVKVFLSYEKNGKKQLLFKKKKVEKFSDYIGTIPCVLLTLDDLKLTMGFPSARRKFMDILLSQVSKVYLQNLKLYKKVVQQRNKLLNEESFKSKNDRIEIWNEQLTEFGSFIIQRRLEFVDFLNSYISEDYQKFSKLKEKITVRYKSSFGSVSSFMSLEKINHDFKNKLRVIENTEREKKITLIGPHRDDLEFLKRGKSFKEYCSQGENKTLIIVLKILEWKFVTNLIKNNPIMLLDDIFGELDRSRIEGLFGFLKNIGQAFITTTSEDKFNGLSIKNNLYLENLEIKYG